MGYVLQFVGWAWAGVGVIGLLGQFVNAGASVDPVSSLIEGWLMMTLMGILPGLALAGLGTLILAVQDLHPDKRAKG